MSDSDYVTPLTSSVNDDDIFESHNWDLGFREPSVDLSDWIEPQTMKHCDDNPIIADQQEQGPFPGNLNFDDQAGCDTTNLLAQESDQLVQNSTIQQMYKPISGHQVNEGSTFLVPIEDGVAQHEDATSSETYDLMASISEEAAKSTSNKHPGYSPAVTLSSPQQQQQPQYVPDPVFSVEEQLLFAFSNDDGWQERVGADERHGHEPENLASQALNTDWSSARQSYEMSLQLQTALPHQRQTSYQLPQQSAPQQPKATVHKRKRNTDRSTGFTRAPKKGKVTIERSVMKNGDVEVCKSDVTPEYAAAVEKNERHVIKEVKNVKRLGLPKGLRAAKYKKRCRGDDCNEYETDCRCPGGFVN